MSTLLMQLSGNLTLNRTIFPPFLYVYDDLLIYKKRHWFVVKEITISYNQIAQVILTRGIIFATLKVETTGEDDIIVKYVRKKKAVQAKKIIDQKIFHSHAKHSPNQGTETNDIKQYEKSLNRLKELVNKDVISEREYEKKKDQLLKNLR
jgi:hypothetical protein